MKVIKAPINSRIRIIHVESPIKLPLVEQHSHACLQQTFHLSSSWVDDYDTNRGTPAIRCFHRGTCGFCDFMMSALRFSATCGAVPKLRLAGMCNKSLLLFFWKKFSIRSCCQPYCSVVRTSCRRIQP